MASILHDHHLGAQPSVKAQSEEKRKENGKELLPALTTLMQVISTCISLARTSHRTLLKSLRSDCIVYSGWTDGKKNQIILGELMLPWVSLLFSTKIKDVTLWE